MADSPASTNSALPGESPAQTKARLRRERLAAKSGASRLQQITALQGVPPKDLKEIEKDVPGKHAPPFQQISLHMVNSSSVLQQRMKARLIAF